SSPMPFGSCFLEVRFTRLLRAAPERSSPQADNRKACGHTFKIFRGIPVPIGHETAVLATKHPLRQVQFGFYRTAAGTGLARRIPPIHHDDCRAIKAGLVLKLPPKLEETAVHNRAGKAAVARHAAHVQIPNADPPETFRQPRRRLVGGILADVGNASMKP